MALTSLITQTQINGLKQVMAREEDLFIHEITNEEALQFLKDKKAACKDKESAEELLHWLLESVTWDLKGSSLKRVN